MKNKELYNKIQKASDEISLNSRNPGNFMIVSSEIYELIENLDIKKHRKKKLIKINKINEKTSE